MNIEIDTGPIYDAARRVGASRQDVADAVVEALNIIAFRSRRAERENIRDSLDRPKPFTVQSIAALRATRNGDLVYSAVYALPALAEILHRLEYGGHLPKGLAIADVTLENQYGSLRRNPRELLNEPGRFEAVINGIHGIWERIPNSTKLKLLVVLISSAVTYNPQLGFRAVAEIAGEVLTDEVRYQVERRLRARLSG